MHIIKTILQHAESSSLLTDGYCILYLHKHKRIICSRTCKCKTLSVHIVARIIVLHIHTCMLYHVHGLHIHHVLISTPASMNSLFTFTIGSLRKGIACSFAAVALPVQYYKFSVCGSRTAIPNGNIHPRSVLK